MTISNDGKRRLNPTKAPALPYAPAAYQPQHIDQSQRILTQYLTQNDNINNSLLGIGGGRYLSFPHIAALDTTNQYATGDNIATKVLWNAAASNIGFTLHNDNTAATEMAGIYKIDYSLQLANTASQIHDVYVWLHVDGYDVVGSTSRFSVPNEHGGVPGYVVAYSSVVFDVPANDKIALYWATDKAATSGGGTGVYMPYYAAQTSPFAMPSTPSAIGSIVFVSGVIA